MQISGKDLAQLKQPGRRGVEAAMSLYERLPKDLRPALLALGYRHRIPRATFQWLLLATWTMIGRRVAGAAGSLERLIEWFRYADFEHTDLPFLKGRVEPSALPERVTLWRGGRGDPETISRGLSWTTLRPYAARYAHYMHGPSRWDTPGSPIVLRCEARCEQVLANIFYGEVGDFGYSEVVLGEHDSWTTDITDSQEIARAAQAAQAYGARAFAAAERLKARVAAMTLEEIWQGWDGERSSEARSPLLTREKADAIESAVLALAAPAALNSALHGPAHWRRVIQVGRELALATPGADPLVTGYFGLIYDSQRLHDGYDPDHGWRAAKVARRLHGTLGTSEKQLNLLCRACALHTSGTTSPDPTIGACWDADRLDLPRVGIRPHPRLMSTSAGRAAAMGVGPLASA